MLNDFQVQPISKISDANLSGETYIIYYCLHRLCQYVLTQKLVYPLSIWSKRGWNTKIFDYSISISYGVVKKVFV